MFQFLYKNPILSIFFCIAPPEKKCTPLIENAHSKGSCQGLKDTPVAQAPPSPKDDVTAEWRPKRTIWTQLNTNRHETDTLLIKKKKPWNNVSFKVLYIIICWWNFRMWDSNPRQPLYEKGTLSNWANTALKVQEELLLQLLFGRGRRTWTLGTRFWSVKKTAEICWFQAVFWLSDLHLTCIVLLLLSLLLRVVMQYCYELWGCGRFRERIACHIRKRLGICAPGGFGSGANLSFNSAPALPLFCADNLIQLIHHAKQPLLISSHQLNRTSRCLLALICAVHTQHFQ